MTNRTASTRSRKTNRLVTIQHATPRRNVRSIFLTGLQPGLAKGKLKAVWLHASTRTAWATSHVADRHHVAEGKVVVLTVQVPRSWLRRHSRGVWYCNRTINPRQIMSVGGLKLFRPAV